MKNLLLLFFLITDVAICKAQACDALFSYSQNGTTVQFVNESSPPNFFATFQWDFGDGTTASGYDATHTYNQYGQFVVCLQMETPTGCTDSYCDTIQIDSILSNNCTASFSYTISGQEATFFNNSSWGSSQADFIWDFGDNFTSSAFEPTHTFTNVGWYNVCLTITTANGCTDTYCNNILVSNSTCTVSFTTQISGGNVQFSAVNGSGNPGSYYWWFGNGGTAYGQNPNYTFMVPGTYTACVQFSDSFCSAVFCDTFEITSVDSCSAAFSYQEIGDGVAFTPAASNFLIQYHWDFGDGTSSGDASVFHIFPAAGTYTVCLTVEVGNCTDTFCETLYYLGDTSSNSTNCNAYFELSDVDTTTNTIWLADLSSGGDTYFWSFGDGNYSSEQYPSHTYDQDGVYLVCLLIQCDSNVISYYCLSLGMADSLIGGGSADTRSGFTLNVKPGVISGVPIVNIENSLTVFPNPAFESVIINLPAGSSRMGLLLVRNVMGNVILEREFITDEGSHVEFDIGAFQTGLYILQIKTGDKFLTGRLIKQ